MTDAHPDEEMINRSARNGWLIVSARFNSITHVGLCVAIYPTKTALTLK